MAAGFFDAGWGRFLTTPAAGGVAVAIAGAFAFIASYLKTSADREVARKLLTHSERYEAYHSFDKLSRPAHQHQMSWAWHELSLQTTLFSNAFLIQIFRIEPYDEVAAMKALDSADVGLLAKQDVLERTAPTVVADAAWSLLWKLKTWPAAYREIVEATWPRAVRIVVLFGMLQISAHVQRRFQDAWRADLGLEPRPATRWWRYTRTTARVLRDVLIAVALIALITDVATARDLVRDVADAVTGQVGTIFMAG